MMRQYKEIKKKHGDALLFFRLGDFYEMFFEDAVEVSGLLGLTLTGRGKDEKRVPMCGVPHHAADGYIAKLTKMGKRVAICDQISDPKERGIVEREVTRVVTPGTTFDEKILDGKANNFVGALCPVLDEAHDGAEGDGRFEFAYADVTTGEFYGAQRYGAKYLRAATTRTMPKEIVVPSGFLENEIVCRLRGALAGVFFFEHEPGGDVEAAGAQGADALLMDYLRTTQKNSLEHLHPTRRDDNEFMPLDEATLKNLELLETLREGNKEGSLLWVLDRTQTSMGGRLLRSFLTNPLLNKGKIDERLDAAMELTCKRALLENLRETLKSVMDLERLLSRLSMGRGSARDLTGLKNSLRQAAVVRGLLADTSADLIKEIRDNIDPLEDLTGLIGRAIVSDPPLNMNEGGIIADGYNRELDELKAVSGEGKRFIQGLQQQEIERTGINNLKVRYNKVFGYYLEVSKGQVGKVPQEWIRKQTTVNAERYITPELKEFEEKVLGAQEKIIALEQKIFTEIRATVLVEIKRIQRTAKRLALLDVLCSFAKVALENGYCKPLINDGGNIIITAGRHPVVEKMSYAARFVPNDTELIQDGERFHLITGPNMGGKSTYLRQTALIVLMAQIGSFVPATKAEIGLVDRIFTRVGASDNLVKGQSTFMVEMQEAAHILENASEHSLIILDEIGRGTSTYDGMSIAWAIMEFIHDKVGAKTLFATHYHELISLTDKLQNAANYSVAALENEKDGVVFLYKVGRGGASRSYGIEVAKLAGMPAETVARAYSILRDLEEGALESGIAKELLGRPAHGQVELFGNDAEQVREHNPIKEELARIDTDNITPMEALKRLAELKNMD
ncbi:DNA mismatch repair protein MutS [Patescibacteria group bacterium]|nr:DNA mismatch repair protein MutS [Patescibacteria group bacterium]MBU1703716.1 DNA mismatch repair protein MutS [Patescibacteria group bacterium]MBU1953539.1 DNA mismatch repair protein MutS [Patescibacteria group bacterium]